MKLPAITLYPGDWLRDDVSGCSLTAQGLWLRMMFLMHDSDRYGYLSMNGSVIPSESLARRCGCDSLTQYEALLSELGRAGVPGVTKEGVIFSRRMVRDAKKRKDAVLNGKKGGNPFLKGRVNPPPNPSPEDEIEDSFVSVPDFCSREGIGEGMRSDGFPDAWRDWRAYRAEKGEPLTSYTASGTMQKCLRWGPKKATQIIRNSIEKSWKNLLEPSEINQGFGKDSKSKEPEKPKVLTDHEKSILLAKDAFKRWKSLQIEERIAVEKFLNTLSKSGVIAAFSDNDQNFIIENGLWRE